MRRRTFLQLSAAGAVHVAATGCQSPAPEHANGGGSGRFDLVEATIGQLGDAMSAGKTTSADITRAYLERIEALDRRGPALRAMISVNPAAVDTARSLDQERKSKGPRGPLHGIPIVVKDNIDTADLPTTAGSLALEGSIPARDAFIIERLRGAGAIVLGKTNLSEWANIRSSHSSSGWSAVGGQARNPYALERNPCGSSSGTGVAVSASLAAVGIGTETDGSIVCPSHSCGLVGLKPTVGLLSRSGIIPISHTQDTPGPMARTVTDAAILLTAMVGRDERDSATEAAERRAVDDYTASLRPDALRGARIGVARQFFGFHPQVDALAEKALERMREAGAELVDPANIATIGKFEEAELQILLYELKADLAAYLAGLGAGAKVRTLGDVIAFNEQNADREMPHFGQDLFVRAQALGPLSSPEYLEAVALAARLTRAEGIDAVVAANRLDAIAAPTGGPAWITDPINGDHFLGGSSSPAAVAGYPNITVPMGWVGNLPIGISMFGPAWSEPKLLGLAYAYEQLTGHRKPPVL